MGVFHTEEEGTKKGLEAGGGAGRACVLEEQGKSQGRWREDGTRLVCCPALRGKDRKTSVAERVGALGRNERVGWEMGTRDGGLRRARVYSQDVGCTPFVQFGALKGPQLRTGVERHPISGSGTWCSKVRRDGRERVLGLARIEGPFLRVWRGNGQFGRRLEVVRGQDPWLQTCFGRFGQKKTKRPRRWPRGQQGHERQ